MFPTGHNVTPHIQKETKYRFSEVAGATKVATYGPYVGQWLVVATPSPEHHKN